MNVDKTKAKVLGLEVMPHDNLFGLDWTEDAIHTLGVSLSGDENDHYIMNYKKRLKIWKIYYQVKNAGDCLQKEKSQ